jgi:hypothetical protein
VSIEGTSIKGGMDELRLTCAPQLVPRSSKHAKRPVLLFQGEPNGYTMALFFTSANFC